MNFEKFRAVALASLLCASVGCSSAETEGTDSVAAEVNEAQPVRLLSASVEQACSSCFGLTGRAIVRNTAYDKHVSFAYAIDSGPWLEAPLHYVGPADAGNEVWELSQTSLSFMAEGEQVHLAVKYVANGKEHWDNNHKANYDVTRNANILAPGVNVLLKKSWTSPNQQNVVGQIAVRDLGFEKKVTVLYTKDHWRTTGTAAAHFGASAKVAGADGVELWNFQIPEPQVSVEAAISYSVNGATYWDNNFGQNYKMTF